MIEKPIVLVGELARKVQAAATDVALKAAKVAEAMNRKVASIQARAAARAQAKALKALPRKPTVEFLREMGHGRTTISFYRITNHRAGTVRHVWGLNRVTPEGRRVRLASGSMAELKSLQSILNRSLTPERRARQTTERAPRSIERAQSPSQQNSSLPRQAQDRSEGKRWYTLVYIEKVDRDGIARGHVVKNFTDLKKAEAHQKRHPSLIIQERDRPFRHRDPIHTKLSPTVAQRIGEERQNGVKQEVSNAVVNQLALQQERRQTLSR